MIFVTTVSVVTVTYDKSLSSTMIVGRATGPQFPSPSHVVLVTEDVIRGASGLVIVDKTVARVVICVVPHRVTEGRCSHCDAIVGAPSSQRECHSSRHGDDRREATLVDVGKP